jgi:hypothetical protein
MQHIHAAPEEFPMKKIASVATVTVLLVMAGTGAASAREGESGRHHGTVTSTTQTPATTTEATETEATETEAPESTETEAPEATETEAPEATETEATETEAPEATETEAPEVDAAADAAVN